MIFALLLVENCLHCYYIHYFSVWTRTCSNPADINQFTLQIVLTDDRFATFRLGEIAWPITGRTYRQRSCNQKVGCLELLGG